MYLRTRTATIPRVKSHLAHKYELRSVREQFRPVFFISEPKGFTEYCYARIDPRRLFLNSPHGSINAASVSYQICFLNAISSSMKKRPSAGKFPSEGCVNPGLIRVRRMDFIKHGSAKALEVTPLCTLTSLERRWILILYLHIIYSRICCRSVGQE